MDYNDKLKLAKEALNSGSYDKKTIEYIFPELKEKDSEDEKIRKKLIKLLRNLFNNYSYFIKDPFYTECINWLEKQDEKKIIWHNKDEEPCEDRQVLICLSGNYYVDFYHKEDKRFYMFYKPKHYLHEIEKWAYIDDLLERKNDNADKVEPKDYNIDPQFGKPTNKVESKFHEGDFIKHKHNKINIICKVISVNSGSYHVENVETSSGIELFNAEQNFHLWTLNEAKDGDVLVYEDYDAVKIFIYQYGKVHCYCSLTNSTFVPHSYYFGVQEDQLYRLHPADKKQRDLLFARIKEEGYEWDAEKKELIKFK